MNRNLRKIKNVVVAIFVATILILTIIDGVKLLIKEYRATVAKPIREDSYVRMLDVGQGDCILLYSGGKAALIDTGTKAYAKSITKELKNEGIDSLDLMVISHNHSDHMGGIVPLTEEFRVKKLIVPDLNKTDEKTDKMQTAMSNVKKSGGKCETAKKGMEISLGDFDLTVIGCYYDEQDENDRSIILKAKIGKWRFLFTGDAQEPTEKRLIADNADIRCDVLKVGHHGSMYGTSEEFLAAASPSLAMISCGKGNRYSHPHDVVLMRLDEAGVKYFRTDTLGSVTFTVTEKEIKVDKEE